MKFEIVCPDGRVRHMPYSNEDDAEFDADVAVEQCQFYPRQNVLEQKHGPCPGGAHTVRETSTSKATEA